MGIFSHDQTPDNKVRNLEHDAQTIMQRIGTLRAQISKLTSEEKQLQTDYDAAKQRAASFQKRREELESMKQEQERLAADLQQRGEKQKELTEELAKLQEQRRTFISRIATLRSQVANEENDARKDKAKLEELEKILGENAARKKKILDDIEFSQKSGAELAELEKQYKQIAETIPLMRKKYEQTRLLVEEMKKNTEPVARAVQEIWAALPQDVLDKRLVIPPRPAEGKV